MQGFNCGQGCTKRRILNGLCFETRKRLLAVRGGSERLHHLVACLEGDRQNILYSYDRDFDKFKINRKEP
ncbi:MAG: hypothetical protein U9Q89_07615 [Thermodesulfobacteriota bacterium]|nr:hypothetical protein [Thermodesulfobacteriota bacterium]